MKTVPCVCCGNPANVKANKRGAPVITCGPCGAVTLVNSRKGREAFSTRYAWTAPASSSSSGSAVPTPKEPAAAPAPAPASPAKGGHRGRRLAR